MNLDTNGYNLIKGFEGLKLKAYKDSVGIWTIGYGNITYKDGSKVKQGDSISQDEANDLFNYYADKFAAKVASLIKKPINQNQFNAVVSLAYNIGVGAFGTSSVLRKMNINPNDPTIKESFEAWNKGTIGGKKVIIQGLVNRRKKESELYFKK